MKLTIDKDWFIRRTALEEDVDVAAGLPARDPFFDEARSATPAPVKAARTRAVERGTSKEHRALEEHVAFLSKPK